MPDVNRPQTMTRIVGGLVKQSKRHVAATTGGGFDPNADPVVIGNGADGHASGGAVAVGSFAETGDTDAIAIGDAAVADASAAIAIGQGAGAHGARSISMAGLADNDDSIAIGWGSNAVRAVRGVAVGKGATVATGADDSTALGPAAEVDAGHARSTALGYGATTTAADQIMLGGLGQTVVLPGDLDVSGLPSSDPGISGLVWNNGGVLTVSP